MNVVPNYEQQLQIYDWVLKIFYQLYKPIHQSLFKIYLKHCKNIMNMYQAKWILLSIIYDQTTVLRI